MTKVRVFLFAALALLVVLGVSGQAQAADIHTTDGTSAHLFTYARPLGNIAPNTAALLAGMGGWDGYPVTGYPCFAPNSPCTTDAAGNVVMGIPLSFWPVAGSGTTSKCTNVKKQNCGQIFAFTQSTTASGAVSATISIKQGKTSVYTKKLTGLGTASAGDIIVVALDGPKLKAAAKAGVATITVVTTVGTAKASSKATVNLM